jgi:hypothetical protein
MGKYRAALELYNNMTNSLSVVRPDCEEILKRQNSWALKEIEIENELKNVLNSRVMSEDNYIYSILESKTEEYFKADALKNYDSGTDLNLKKDLINQNFQLLNAIESMNSYEENGVSFLKSLYILNEFTKKNVEPFPDLIDLMIVLMKNYSKNILIQKTAFECLRRIIQRRSIDNIALGIFEKVVEVTLKAMETFPNHQQIQEFGLSILREDSILQDVAFDRYKCMQLVVNSVVCFEDKDMKGMAIYICSEISRYLSTDEKKILTLKTDLMGNLLETVRRRAKYVPFKDFLFENSLTTLSNLTESSPGICKLFIKKDGLELCSLILIVILSTDIELFSKYFFLFKNFRHIWINIL